MSQARDWVESNYVGKDTDMDALMNAVSGISVVRFDDGETNYTRYLFDDGSSFDWADVLVFVRDKDDDMHVDVFGPISGHNLIN